MDNISEDVIKLIVALVMGAIIGAEREYKSKAAGFRTVILITLGSTLFTMMSVIIGGKQNPDRIASNILTGIGFIGAGAIFKEGSFVKGLTTASVIWASAAIGMSIGIGHYEFASISLVIVMMVLISFNWLQKMIDKTNVNKVYKITIIGNQPERITELEAIIASHNLKSKCTLQAKRSSEMILNYSVSGREQYHDDLVKDFYSNSLIDSFE